MKIIKPSVEILSKIDPIEVYKTLETAGRTCYKSEHNITDTSYEKFLKSVIARDHGAVLEHYSISVKFICDRGVSHEIVRHRMASYCQESTRYCNYAGDKFDNQLTFIKPCFWDDRISADATKLHCWYHSCGVAEYDYFTLIEAGATPQEARTVLPNSLKTELVMTANIREWRHFFKLRCDKAAHPQMREVAIMLLDQFKEKLPILFGDLDYKF